MPYHVPMHNTAMKNHNSKTMTPPRTIPMKKQYPATGKAARKQYSTPQEERGKVRELELRSMAQHCRVYMDTCSLMHAAGLHELLTALRAACKKLLIPACVYTELESLTRRNGCICKAAAKSLRRVQRRLNKGQAEICCPETAGMNADEAMLHILSALPAGEKVLFITKDRELAARLAEQDTAAMRHGGGRIMVRRLAAGGELQQLRGVHSASAASLGLTPWVVPPMPVFCPYAYKPGDWNGNWEEEWA